MLRYHIEVFMNAFLNNGSSDFCRQFQSPAVKSEQGPRSAVPYNATLLIGMSVVLSCALLVEVRCCSFQA